MAVDGILTVRVSDLIRGLPISPVPETEREGQEVQEVDIQGITHDSRRVTKGDLYVALVGERFDGRVFAPEAVERGAAAVLAAGAPPTEHDGLWLRSDDPRRVLGPLAARLNGHPDRELLTVGITGTNGKSTVAALLTAILEAAGKPTGTLGTLGYTFRSQSYRGERTTPEASQLFRTLREIRDASGEAVVMEVSSHALDQGRVGGLEFDAAVFTNLSRDHFDYHRGFEDYFESKRSLFSQLKSDGVSVINIDDPHGRRLAEDLGTGLTFGCQNAEADVRLVDAEIGEDGTRAIFSTPRGELEIESPLLGRYNLENIAAAVAGSEALDVEHDAVVRGVALCGVVPGRMEPVNRGQDFPVFIDYAHTDRGLEAALTSLRELSGRGRIAVVFGCGGDRDPGKRVLMGLVAGKLAELPIVTSDNPRNEDPLEIIAAVEEGLKQSGNRSFRVIPDRGEAIRRAIAHVDSSWAVLVAGKGHEEVQIVGTERLRFSDRDAIIRALEDKLGSRHAG